LGKAVTYAINQWPTLIVFLEDGGIPIDNLHVERRHRPVALGRRNYLLRLRRGRSPARDHQHLAG
jgi:transposase